VRFRSSYRAVFAHARKIDFVQETDFGRGIGVVLAAVDAETVDAILIAALGYGELQFV
jgi:hypothetical protein